MATEKGIDIKERFKYLHIRNREEAKTPQDRLLLAKPPVSRATRRHLEMLGQEPNPRGFKESIHQ